MLKVDVPIWYEFLEKYKEKFLAIYYDCRLGGPGYTPTEYDEKLRGMWKYLGAKRADVIAETKDQIWIIEVTSTATIKAIGQLMLYKSLWEEDAKIDKPVEMVLVFDKTDRDVIAIMEVYNIHVFLQKGGANSKKTTPTHQYRQPHSPCDTGIRPQLLTSLGRADSVAGTGFQRLQCGECNERVAGGQHSSVIPGTLV